VAPKPNDSKSSAAAEKAAAEKAAAEKAAAEKAAAEKAAAEKAAAEKVAAEKAAAEKAAAEKTAADVPATVGTKDAPSQATSASALKKLGIEILAEAKHAEDLVCRVLSDGKRVWKEFFHA
jgi:colicin import membrane protein